MNATTGDPCCTTRTSGSWVLTRRVTAGWPLRMLLPSSAASTNLGANAQLSFTSGDQGTRPGGLRGEGYVPRPGDRLRGLQLADALGTRTLLGKRLSSRSVRRRGATTGWPAQQCLIGPTLVPPLRGVGS